MTGYNLDLEPTSKWPQNVRKISNMPAIPERLRGTSHQINRRLLEVERASHNSGLSGDIIQYVMHPAICNAPGRHQGRCELAVVEVRPATDDGAFC